MIETSAVANGGGRFYDVGLDQYSPPTPDGLGVRNTTYNQLTALRRYKHLHLERKHRSLLFSDSRWRI